MVPWQMMAVFQNTCYRRGESMSQALRDLMQRYVVENPNQGER